MRLDCYEGHLFIEKDGEAGVIVHTLHSGKEIRFEEKNGQIHVSERPSQDNTDIGAGMIVVRRGKGGKISSTPSTQSLCEFVAELLSKAQNGKLSDARARLLETADREIFSQAIKLARGNQTKAARWLGVARITMRKKLTEFGRHPSRNGS